MRVIEQEFLNKIQVMSKHDLHQWKIDLIGTKVKLKGYIEQLNINFSNASSYKERQSIIEARNEAIESIDEIREKIELLECRLSDKPYPCKKILKHWWE